MSSRFFAAVAVLLVAFSGCSNRKVAKNQEAPAAKAAPTTKKEPEVVKQPKTPDDGEKPGTTAKQEQSPEPPPPQAVDLKAKQAEEDRAREKRAAKEKLLLLEKEQAKDKIEDLMISVRADKETLEKNRLTIEKADADWKAQRMSTFDNAMLKDRLEGEDSRAMSRRDKFLNVIIELEKKIKDIDAQLKALYEEALQE